MRGAAQAFSCWAALAAVVLLLQVGGSAGTQPAGLLSAIGAGSAITEADPQSGALTATLTEPVITLNDTGLEIPFDYSVSGGTPPYTWTLQKNGSSANLSGLAAPHDSGSFAIASASPGTYTYWLNVTDADSDTASASIQAQWFLYPTLDVSYAPTHPTAGNSIYFATGLVGGAPPDFEEWCFGNTVADYIDGYLYTCANTSYDNNTAWTPLFAGSYAVNLTFEDGANTVLYANLSVTVGPSTGGGSGSPPCVNCGGGAGEILGISVGYWYAFGAIALVAAAAVAIAIESAWKHGKERS